MHYFEKYNYLTDLYHQKEGTYNLTDFNVQISNYNFKSSDADILSGGTKYISRFGSQSTAAIETIVIQRKEWDGE